MDWSSIVALAMDLPGVEEGLSYGLPSLKVKGKFFSRVRDEGTVLVVRTNLFGRRYLIDSDPRKYFVTDHYRDHPYVLVDLRLASQAEVRERLQEGWREVAPARLVKEMDARQSTRPEA
jgi:hypothetical protein